jgi:uncharacterized protein YndB with AHSA1/START domain
MAEEFEVRWEGVLPADPEKAWDALTNRTTSWIWEISYEPRMGGAERGLTSAGGTVTAWDPPRHFQTRAERPDGWRNALDYTLEESPGGTLLRWFHTGVMLDYDAEYEQCVQHTDLYCHTVGEYLAHFTGRDAAYVGVDAPGSFAALRRRLGVPEGAAAGDRVRLEPDGLPPLDGTIDYLTPRFLGVRTADTMVRCFGRDAWGGTVGIGLHLFAPGADAAQAGRTWSRWLDSTLATGAVA